MKILWICNVKLPKISYYLGETPQPFGGWLTGLSDELLKKDIELVYCYPLSNQNESGKDANFSFWGFDRNGEVESFFSKLIKNEKPDVVHLFGTEMDHAYKVFTVVEKLNMIDRFVVSIQGLVSVYAKHYYALLPNNVVNSVSFYDLVKRCNIKNQKKDFECRGKLERKILSKTKYVIGRTDWDEACVRAINPDVNWMISNESLRTSFYKGKWSYNNCNQHTIFIGQCHYPIKGLHNVIEQIPQLLIKYPDLKIRIAGKGPECKSFHDKLRDTSYNKFLRKRIKQLGITDMIEFLGVLSEEQMRDEYLKCNVFILPSAIENSPNSLGEAMLMGVPVVASDVGGVKNLMVHDIEGIMYPFDEPYMIPYYVSRIFDNVEYAEKLSRAAIAHAKELYDRESNVITLIHHYKTVMNYELSSLI